MATTLGSLVLSLRADSSTFASDLGKAATMAEASANKMAKSLAKVNEAFGMLAGGFGFQQMLSYSNSVIVATAHLGELSAATGLTVPVLSSLAVTAKGVGMTVDDAAGAFDRMQRQAALAVGGSRTQAAAFAAVGINATQLAAGLKDPQAMLLSVAGAMEKFADDGNKTALMMTIFGKGGAGMTSMLHELATAGYANANATAEQAAQAEAFEKQMAQLGATIQGATRSALMSIIPTVRLVGAGIFTAFSDMWIDITLAWDKALDSLTFKVTSWRSKIIDAAKGVAIAAIPIVGPLIAGLMPPPAAALSATSATAEKNAAAAHAQNARIMAEASADYVNATAPPVIAAVAKLPSIVPPAKVQKIPVEHDVLAKQMADRLKIISDAMKQEDAVTKLANTAIDADYKQGIVSIADYAQQKSDILNKNTALTQSLYDSQIAMVQTYVDQLTKMVANETNIQRKQTERKELDAAAAKAGELASAKALDLTKAQQEQITLTEKIIADGKTLSATVLNTAIAYATMTGNVELANALQIEQQDGMTKTILATNGMTDATKQLLAVEEDRRMRASQSPFDGMNRAVIDYQKGLADVAKATESITTNMLSGMEDALVTFVKTGKLSFTALIDSMITDLIRLMLRQQVMPGLASMLGLGVSAMGGGSSTAVTFDSSSAMGSMASGIMTPMATGGPVYKGQGLTVGERGPERFVPSMAGTIIPNGAAGAGNIVYSPTIQIDSRADRSQVQADTVSAVRQGQKELLLMLKRYNPGLKA